MKHRPNYITNSTEWDCGPTVLTNLIIWLGCAERSSSLRQSLIHVLDCDEEGTYDEDLDRWLRESGSNVYGFKVRITKKPRHKSLLNHMHRGGAVILAHIDITEEWHYSLWFYKKDKLIGVNVISNIDEPILSFNDDHVFSHLCYKHDKSDRPVAWMITR